MVDWWPCEVIIKDLFVRNNLIIMMSKYAKTVEIITANVSLIN